MNKDVKIGLAIGLLLLVGLFVWLAIVSSGKPTPDTGLPDREAERVAPATTSSRERPATEVARTPEPRTETPRVTIEVGRPATTTPGTAADDLTPEARRYLELLREPRPDTTAVTPTRTTPPTITTPTVMTPATPATYIVKSGDSLSTISQQVYGTARFWQRIARENNITDPTRVAVNAVLKIPPLAEDERVLTTGVTTAPSGQQTHKVQDGETLSDISQKYYGSVRHIRRIMEANRLTDENFLQIGQVLVIPKLTETPVAVGTTPAPALARTPGEYVVQEGDTLGSIAQQIYGSSRFYTIIMKANGIDYADAVRPGQKLVIPPKPTVEPTPGREPVDPGLEPGERRYVVKEGDTLTDIASQEMGSSREYIRLMERNNLTDAHSLQPGQVIVIPARGAFRVLSTEARER